MFAHDEGAVAAPTAGLHFTDTLLERLAARGVAVHKVTLHVGPGTFLPVHADDTAGHKMHSEHAVLTAVNRDDQPDGGAHIFAAAIRKIRERLPECKVEVLIPDFEGNWQALELVMEQRPDVLNHNIETVPRLYRMARSGGRYPRSLELLDRSRNYRPDIATKTGIMVGLGEEREEILTVFDDLRRVGVSILTIGQYLRPSPTHAKMARYYHPDEFADLKRVALEKGFVHVESGPLVRSSYHAHEQADAFEATKTRY